MIEQSGDSLIQKVRVRIGHDILSQVEIVQGDTARELHFFFEDYIVPTDAECRIYLRKPSGLEVYKQCTLEDNEIIVPLTSQMSAEDGITQGQLQIIKSKSDSEDKAILSTFPFTLLVAENMTTNIISSNEFEILDGLIDEARILILQMETLISTFTNQENNRVEAEKIRVQNENERIANENARKAAETARKQAESERDSAEQTRQSQESTRESNESARKTNESNRQSAEETRNNNEEARKTAESQRVTAEEQRESQESTRESNETQRKNNESTRVSQESIRQIQEEGRVEAEKLREQNSQTALQQAQSAISNANSAQSTVDQLIEEMNTSLDNIQNVTDILQDFGTITDEEINSVISEVIT